MHREHHCWHSHHLNRPMNCLVHGHAGAKLLVFPTSKGCYFEWEDRRMMDALRDHIERGWLQVYSVDCVDEESWYAYHKWPGDRAFVHQKYMHYLLDEVLPFANWKNPTPFQIVAGASFGGFHAISFAMMYPDRVNRVINMSGLTDIRRFLSGYHDQNVYSVNPVEFIPNEHDPYRLHHLRNMDIVLAVGKDDGLRGCNEELHGSLWNKGVGCALRLWDGWSHDWQYWQKMMRLYVGGHD